MKISFLNSICVENDAVSASIRDEIKAIQESGFAEPCFFGYDCHFRNLPFVRVTSAEQVLSNRHFLSSRIAIFHFGIFYPLFNMLPAIPRRIRRVVRFHNITPREFVPAESRSLIDRSFQQLSNTYWADHIVCDSTTNAHTLESRGIRKDSFVLPLSVTMPTQVPPAKPSFRDGVVRIVFVGRFVQSKGIRDLVASIAEISSNRNTQRLQVDMVGNKGFSDGGVISEVMAHAEDLNRDHNRNVVLRFHFDASDATRNALLEEADVFALPTYHEGFCVPIVEAIAQGCLVISYSNSNVPAISGSLAELVETGDGKAFSLAMRRILDKVESDEWKAGSGDNSYAAYRERARGHVTQFAEPNVHRQFLSFLQRITAKEAVLLP